MEYRNFIDPEIIHNNMAYCFVHGGPKDCHGKLHRTTYKLYDENYNLIEENNDSIGKWVKTSTMNDIVFNTNIIRSISFIHFILQKALQYSDKLIWIFQETIMSHSIKCHKSCIRN